MRHRRWRPCSSEHAEEKCDRFWAGRKDCGNNSARADFVRREWARRRCRQSVADEKKRPSSKANPPCSERPSMRRSRKHDGHVAPSGRFSTDDTSREELQELGRNMRGRLRHPELFTWRLLKYFISWLSGHSPLAEEEAHTYGVPFARRHTSHSVLDGPRSHAERCE